jgi:hypothetical protein
MTPIPLSRTDRSTKILITLFLLSILCALAVAELNVFDKVGRVNSGIVARYGPEVAPAPDAPLPNENEPIVARLNTFASLLDITHPHIFQIPLIIFVLAHFLARTRSPEWFKLLNYFTAFFGAAAFMAAPWMVRYWTIKAALVLPSGAAAVGFASLAMIFVPLWDMWRGPSSKKTSTSITSKVEGEY